MNHTLHVTWHPHRPYWPRPVTDAYTELNADEAAQMAEIYVMHDLVCEVRVERNAS